MARSPSEQYVCRAAWTNSHPSQLITVQHFTRCLNGDESDLAFIRAVEEGIAYLTQPSKKDATISLPSDTCTRVSCSWNSQIQFCNQGSLHNQTTMGDIGRSAKEILDKCRSPYPGAREDFVQGVTWDIGDTWDTQTYVGFDHC